MKNKVSSQDNNDVYEKLYDLIEKNITDDGQKMFFSKEVFVATSIMDKTIFDYQKAKNLSNKEFVYMANRYIYNILPQPDNEYLTSWDKDAIELPKSLLQHRIMRRLIDTIPAVINHSLIINNDNYPVMAPERPAPQEFHNKLLNSLHKKIYCKLPKFLKSIIKFLAAPLISILHKIKKY